MKRLLDRLKELCVVTSSTTVQDGNDSENVKAEDSQKTQMPVLQNNSATTQPGCDDERTSEILTSTPNTDRIVVLNNGKSPLKFEVNESHQPITLAKEETSMEFVLNKERETPGTWRFKENKDERPLTIYLTKEQVKQLGDPESIKVTITAS